MTTHAALIGELQARRAFPDRLGPKGKPLTSTDHKLIGYDVLPFVWNVFKSWRYGEPVMVDDPWGFGNSLEWTTSCPPPRHNFTELPESDRSGRHSKCTSHTWSRGCATNPMSDAATVRCIKIMRWRSEQRPKRGRHDGSLRCTCPGTPYRRGPGNR